MRSLAGGHPLAWPANYAAESRRLRFSRFYWDAGSSIPRHGPFNSMHTATSCAKSTSGEAMGISGSGSSVRRSVPPWSEWGGNFNGSPGATREGPHGDAIMDAELERIVL